MQNLLAVLMALRIGGKEIRPIRGCFAAFFGAFAAWAVRLTGATQAVAALASLPLSLGMMVLAAGRAYGVCGTIRLALTLLACTGFLGGTVLALYGATGSLWAAHLASSALGAAVFVGVLKKRRAAETTRLRVDCMVGEKRIAFDAIVDSGNSLRDYLTHRPVIVGSGKLKEALCADGVRMRPIFADTAGGRQMMLLVIPRETLLIADGRRRSVRAALAFSPGLSGDAPALVPASLVQD